MQTSNETDKRRDVEDEILLERTNLLYENGRYSNGVVLIASAILCFMLWGEVPALTLGLPGISVCRLG